MGSTACNLHCAAKMTVGMISDFIVHSHDQLMFNLNN